jgi:probable phosphoglycerate mutase
MQLIVIRHGQSVINVTRDFTTLEHIDTSLTDLGHQQCAALRDWLREQDVRPDVLYSSTMARCRETSAYVTEAVGMEPIFDDRIREVGNNYADGLPIDTADLPRVFADRPGFVAPFLARAAEPDRVESWMHFRARLGGFIDDLIEQHTGETVYVVAHGGVMTALFEHVFNGGPRRFLTVNTTNTGWSQVNYRTVDQGQGFWALVYHNRIDHLARLET